MTILFSLALWLWVFFALPSFHGAPAMEAALIQDIATIQSSTLVIGFMIATVLIIDFIRTQQCLIH